MSNDMIFCMGYETLIKEVALSKNQLFTTGVLHVSVVPIKKAQKNSQNVHTHTKL